MAEEVGVEGRGQFYEEVGAIRDVVQNHLLEVVALLTMEAPVGRHPDALRDEKQRAFRAMRIVTIVPISGAVEVAPRLGVADAIVDLVSTGSTLKANHLVEVEQIMDISSRLVVNQAALKVKREPIRQLIDIFSSATEKR